MPTETSLRSLLKAVTHRLTSFVINGSVFYLLTNKASLAVGFAVLDFFFKIAVFFIHERIWVLVPFGTARNRQPELSLRTDAAATEQA